MEKIAGSLLNNQIRKKKYDIEWRSELCLVFYCSIILSNIEPESLSF